jgi:hypothetical protein
VIKVAYTAAVATIGCQHFLDKPISPQVTKTSIFAVEAYILEAEYPFVF